jgi:hypothetical protein
MSRTHAAAMSPTHTGSTNAGSYPATSSDTCSPSGTTAASAATSATATTTTTTATATATATGEQRPGRCDQQQGRYCGYRKKLGYPRHDDLLFAFKARRWLKIERATNVPHEK